MALDDRMDHDDRVTLGDTASLKTTATGQLVHLEDLDDVKISSGEPDIRGWDVRGADGTKVGTVEDLLIDTAAMKVRYIEVKLDKDVAKDVGRPADLRAHDITDATMRAERQLDDRDDFKRDDADAGRFVLVPIGIAQLDDDKDDVILTAEAAQMVGIPAYNRKQDKLTRDYESDVVRGYGSQERISGGLAGDDVINAARPSDVHDTPGTSEVRTNIRDPFYEDRNFDDRSFFGNRRRGRDDDAYFVRADEDERARQRQRDDRGLNTLNDDLIDGRTIRDELSR